MAVACSAHNQEASQPSFTEPQTLTRIGQFGEFMDKLKPRRFIPNNLVFCNGTFHSVNKQGCRENTHIIWGAGGAGRLVQRSG